MCIDGLRNCNGFCFGAVASCQCDFAAGSCQYLSGAHGLQALGWPWKMAHAFQTGHRTHSCGELRKEDVGQLVTVCGWVQMSRDMNHFAFVDLRDRYGITQVVFPKDAWLLQWWADWGADEAGLQRYEQARNLGREFVVKVTGKAGRFFAVNSTVSDLATDSQVVERIQKNAKNSSSTPPFKIEDATDANEDTRMRYRYLDIRRNPIKDAILLRNKVTRLVREYLGDLEFCEVETPVLIKSTPEGARDFVVPSRMNPGQFYALPQSPQTFKQLLMVGGLDRYFQIVKCFRDEELRADRQPEFTQIDCEMSFVQQEDVLRIFEGMIRQIFKAERGHEFPPFQRMEYSEAMDRFGIDKPDLRYDMELVDLTEVSKGKNFKMFDDAELVVGMCCKGIGSWSGKKVKDLEKKATGQEVGASALVWLKINPDGTYDCSAKKFFTDEDYVKWVEKANAKPGGCGPGDLLLIIAGKKLQTQESMGKFRHLMGTELGLRSEGFRALWVVNFPMLEWDEDEGRFTAKHHPFTSPWTEDIEKMVSLDHKDPKLAEVRANAYDMVINGVEVGGGSVRIHERPLQEKVFSVLGFSKEEALAQFGFLMGAFEYGAPPHAGLAFGLDRLCTIIGGKATIRDFIAFPKNNMGRDTMINTPAAITSAQLAELSITTTVDEDGKPKASGYPA
ncbi:aspS [Symbiodinium microadriaticum]|nr:aspS [Symbiodinium microadriaticum]